jgi:hypothetical protein
MATVCYLDDDRGTAVGISVCSSRDVPRKRIGRGISLERAKYAQHHYDGEGSYGWDRSKANRLEALSMMVATDLIIGPWERFGIAEGIYKIAFINEPGFRFTRLGKPRTFQGQIAVTRTA